MTEGFHKVPDDWAPVPKGIGKKLNVAILLDAKAIEVRQLPGGAIEWRRAPKDMK